MDAQEDRLQTVTIPGAPPPRVDTKIDRYQLRELLGVGGMGAVHAGFDAVLGRDVAIKLVGETDPKREAWLLSEARALAQVRHPNVVPIYDVGVAAGRVYIVMPLITGGNLRQWLAAEPRPWRAILHKFVAAGRGLAAAHAQSLVHRDFKPDNVLLSGHDVLVADFGLARIPTEVPHGSESRAPTLTRHDVLAGTLPYMAPEQLALAPLDARCDQFAFAVGLWHALYGRHPFDADTIDREPQQLHDRIAKGPAKISSTRGPRAIEPVLRRALAFSADDRWPSMETLLAQLAAFRPRRHWLPFAVAGLAFAAIAGFLAWPAAEGDRGTAIAPPSVAADAPRDTITFTRRQQYHVGSTIAAHITDSVKYESDGALEERRLEATVLVLAVVDSQIMRARMHFGSCGVRHTAGNGRVFDDVAPAADKTYIVEIVRDAILVTTVAHERVPVAEENWVRKTAVSAGVGREDGDAVQMPEDPIHKGDDVPVVAEAMRHEFARGSQLARFAASAKLVEIIPEPDTQVPIGVFAFTLEEDKEIDAGLFSYELRGTLWKRSLDSHTLRLVADGHGTVDGKRVAAKTDLRFEYGIPID